MPRDIFRRPSRDKTSNEWTLNSDCLIFIMLLFKFLFLFPFLCRAIHTLLQEWKHSGSRSQKCLTEQYFFYVQDLKYTKV